MDRRCELFRMPPRASNCQETHRALQHQNTVEDIYNLMTFTNVTTWKGLIYQTRFGQLGVAHTDLWDLFFQGSYDDAGVGRFPSYICSLGSDVGGWCIQVDSAHVHPHSRFHRAGGHKLPELRSADKTLTPRCFLLRTPSRRAHTKFTITSRKSGRVIVVVVVSSNNPTSQSQTNPERSQSGGRELVPTRIRSRTPCSCTFRRRCTSDTETNRVISKTLSM